MFGITAFAQSPFATLGGNSYSVALSEAITLADSIVGTASFAGSISENITVADSILSLIHISEPTRPY